METTALYIGYILMGLIALVLVGMSLLVLWATAFGLYRIIKYKQSIRFLKNHQQKDIYKACKIAVQILISQGISPNDTLEEASNMIENYRIHCKIKED